MLTMVGIPAACQNTCFAGIGYSQCGKSQVQKTYVTFFYFTRSLRCFLLPLKSSNMFMRQWTVQSTIETFICNAAEAMPCTEEGLQERRRTRVGIHCYRLVNQAPENLRHRTGHSLGPRKDLKDDKPRPPGLALQRTLSPGPHLARPIRRLHTPAPHCMASAV